MVLFGEVAEFRSGSQHVFLRISPLDVPRASPGTFPNVGDNDPNLLLTEHSGSQRPCDPSELFTTCWKGLRDHLVIPGSRRVWKTRGRLSNNPTRDYLLAVSRSGIRHFALMGPMGVSLKRAAISVPVISCGEK